MIAELCIDVITSFKVLTSHLETACEHILVHDSKLPAWFQQSERLPVLPESGHREQACKLISQLEYLDGQQPREILVGAGILAASQATLEAIENLNLAKQKFKQAMLKLKAAKISPKHELLIDNFEQLLNERDVGVATTLTRIGLGRIHLKQTYRKIPYFLHRPNKIAWTWANTRSIKRISVEEAFSMLNKLTKDDGIERQIKLLQGLNAKEKLAVVQDLAPHLRANLILPTANGDQRIMVKGPVPIFYLATDNTSLPEFNPPKPKSGKDKDRMIRSDVKINPEVFLPAIRAHRYFATCEI